MSELAERIWEVVAPPAPRLVATFYNPDNGFAGTTFDDLPDNSPDRFSPSDLGTDGW